MLLKLLAGLTMSAVGVVPGAGWHQTAANTYQTSTPGAIIYDNTNGQRVYNNAFREKTQKVTAYVNSRWGADGLTVDSPAQPASNVVAYPSIRYGSFYTDRDVRSGLPLPVSRVGRLTLHVGCSGTPNRGSVYLCDTDAWFHPSRNTNAHGTAEMVVINRASYKATAGAKVWVGRQEYLERVWTTSDPITGFRWPILSFFRVHQTRKSTVIPLAAFTRLVVRQHHLASNAWLGDFAYGPELWQGGKGLHIWMRVVNR